MILSDQEIIAIEEDTTSHAIHSSDAVMFARAIIAATVAKLAQGVSVEPDTYTNYHINNYKQQTYTIKTFNTTIAAARVQALEDAATLVESTELSGLNNDIQLQVFIGKMLIGYVAAIRALIEKEST